jgi:small subunit ribosomal protein S17e
MKDLGKVRPEHVKKTARELIELYPDRFGSDFQTNKQILDTVAEVSSSKLRNRIAGYITRLASTSQKGDEGREAEEDVEEEVE